MNEWEMTAEQIEQMLLQEQQEIDADKYQSEQELNAIIAASMIAADL